MVSSILFLIITVYVSLVIVCTKRLVFSIESNVRREALDAKNILEKLCLHRDDLDAEKMNLQKEAMEIFTLYEITKEITKTQSDEEAFDIFRNRLSRHVAFQECRLLVPLSEEVENLRKEDRYFVFTLQSKKERIGYLAIEGVLPQDREKVMILGHQFALALRRVRLYQEIEQIAITDSLTDVYTRRHAIERFEEELTRSKARTIKMSFLMIDVDFFKKFNDQYGHLTGDQILREIGFLINENIREIDIAGRYGGEEFCVILPDTDRQGAKFAAERIRQAVEQVTIKAYDTAVKCSLSIGTATFPEDGKSMDELIDKADWALYRAKKQGRNRVCSFGVYRDGGPMRH